MSQPLRLVSEPGIGHGPFVGPAAEGEQEPMPSSAQSDFYRIRRLPPYVFEEVNRLKARLRAEGADVIDFGMGNPDMPTAPHIVDKLVEVARNPKAHGYSTSRR